LERDEAPPLKKSKAQHQVVQGAMSGCRLRIWGDSLHDSGRFRQTRKGFTLLRWIILVILHPMMDISDFATDNGPFQLEEGQIPPSASTAGMVQ
jgi:hypothetical protein